MSVYGENQYIYMCVCVCLCLCKTYAGVFMSVYLTTIYKQN